MGVVWESGYPTNADYFNKDQGASDGRVAYAYARDTIGQPAGSAIYFAVDYDASKDDIAGPITDYFDGIVESFRAEGLGNPGYKVGVYGSGATCRAMIAAGVVDFTWLAQSTGWAGHESFVDWNLKQGAGTNLCGIDVDTDEARGAYGGFQVGRYRRGKRRSKRRAKTGGASARKKGSVSVAKKGSGSAKKRASANSAKNKTPSKWTKKKPSAKNKSK